MLRGFPAQRTNAIYGDANAATATVVPDLAAAADGTNFAVSADSSILNFNQRLDLQDLVYETATEEVYSSVIADGHLVIQGNTMGWADVSKMVIEFDVLLSRDINALYPLSTNVNAAASGTNGLVELKYAEAVDRYQYNTDRWTMPNFNFLQPLDQLVIQMGENNQVIGRSQMNYLPGIKMIAQDCKLGPEEFRELLTMGSPCTQSFSTYDMPTRSDAGGGFMINDAGYSYTPEFSKWQSGLYKQINDYLTASTDNIGAIQGAPDRWITSPVPFKIGIPVKYLNSFFRESAYLPPGLRYRFEINYNTNQHFFADTVLYQRDPTQQQSQLKGYVQRWNIQYGKDMRLVYRRDTLRQPQAASIMNQWITRPFLYMYNTYEYVEIPTNGSIITFMKDIAISQQRPSSIFIKVLPDFVGTGYQTRNLTTLPLTVPAKPGNIVLQARDFKASDCTNISYTNIKIDIAGRQQYFLRTRNLTATQLIPSLYDGTIVVNQLTDKNINQDMDQLNAFGISFMAQGAAGGPMEISINPGDMQRNGYMSADVGATVIRVTVDVQQLTQNNTFKPIPAGYKVVIYKRLQEELELDGKKNITTISWPAVKSNSEYIIQNTYNLN